MATLQELELALVNAHKAGDADAARKLAAFIVKARKDKSNQIPDAQVPGTTPETPEPSLMDKIIGGAETDIQLLTGATAGPVGMIAGIGGKMAADIAALARGETPDKTSLEQAAVEGMQAVTYQPRTAAGQKMAEQVGKSISNVIPVMPLTGELNALHASAAPAGNIARTGAAAVLDKAATAAPQIPARIAQAMGRAEPAPGTMASVGSAGTDLALQRRQMASDLPVPIELTRGQAERTFEQQRFEMEAAKDPNLGAPLRDRFAQQNEDIMKNIDAWFDQTGAEAPNLRAVGAAVDEALVKKAARDKAEIRVAYKNAEKAGELAEPVAAAPIANFLNESASAEAVAPVIKATKAELVRLGGAELDDAGNLIPKEMSLANTELLRRFVSKVTGVELTNIKYAADLKIVIDGMTEGMGGNLYKQARALRTRYADQYENRAVIAKLLRTNRGTQDRTVALEDVWNHSIMRGSLDDARAVRRVLQTAGDDGKQAWRELQGATINWIRDEATKGVATDQRGNPIVSAAGLNKAIRSLEHDGKLDFVFGKKGAQQLRDINDLAKVVYTSPPGSVNPTNTASVILAALAEAGVSGSMTGIPVPVLTGLRVIAMRAKDRRIQKRIEEALGRAQRTAEAKKAADPKPPYTKKTIH